MLDDEDLRKIAEIVSETQEQARETAEAADRQGSRHLRRRVVLVTVVVIVITLTDKYVQHHDVLTKTSELTVSALLEWFFTKARESA